jgi:hypothetical protein
VDRQRHSEPGLREPAGTDPGLPVVARVRVESHGRGLPVPPVIPTIAVFCLLVGISLGYGFAPKYGPAPVPSPVPTEIADSRISSQASPTSYTLPPAIVFPTSSAVAQDHGLPPGDGLTLTQVLAQLSVVRPDRPASSVISARVVRLTDVWQLNDALGDPWVWALVFPSTMWTVTSGDGGPTQIYDSTGLPHEASPGAGSTMTATRVETTEMIIIDYYSGAMIGSQTPG